MSFVIEQRERGAGAICRDILAELPEWFGMPHSNAAYARDAEEWPSWIASTAEGPVGLLLLKRHFTTAAEIHLMAVRRTLHRQGVGRALVNVAEQQARAEGRGFLTVKTLSPSREDANYARTRLFYEGMGFVALEELAIWGPDNPALMMGKALTKA